MWWQRLLSKHDAAAVVAPVAASSCLFTLIAALTLPVQAQQPSAWIHHQDPAGFTAETPAGWTAQADVDAGRFQLKGPGGSLVVFWPLFFPDVAAGPAFRDLMGVVTQRAAAALWPEAEWHALAQVAPTTIRLDGGLGSDALMAMLHWIPTNRGSAAYLYAVSVPRAGSASLESTLARILASLRVTPSEAKRRDRPSIQYVRWSDPNENAFSLEVPAQWSVQGGTFRFSAMDVRSGVELQSPEGDVWIKVGDPEVPRFVEPAPPMMGVYYPEGSWYPSSGEAPQLVMRYLSGLEFASWYVQQKIAPRCADLSLTGQRDRPEAAAFVNALSAQLSPPGMMMYESHGEVTFSCTLERAPRRGFWYASTVLVRGSAGPSGNWSMGQSLGFVAAEDRTAEAVHILQHLLRTQQANPQWQRMQRTTNARVLEIRRQSREQIAGIIADVYATRSASQDAVAHRRSNAMLGVEDVRDPVTGRELQVETGSGFYWIDPRGTIVGTDAPSQPSVDFRELLRQP